MYSGDNNWSHDYSISGEKSLIHGALISSYLLYKYFSPQVPCRIVANYLQPVYVSDTSCSSEVASDRNKKVAFFCRGKKRCSSLSYEQCYSHEENMTGNMDQANREISIFSNSTTDYIIGKEYYFKPRLNHSCAPSIIGGSSMYNSTLATCSYLVGMIVPGTISTSISYRLNIDGISRTPSFVICSYSKGMEVIRLRININGCHGVIVASFGRK